MANKVKFFNLEDSGDAEELAKLNLSHVQVYGRCRLNNRLSIHKNDIVCIYSVSSPENQTRSWDEYKTCLIARVKFLYRDLNYEKKPSDIAYVEWYSRPSDLMNLVNENDRAKLIAMNQDWELIRDFRGEAPQVQIEKIFDVPHPILRSRTEWKKCRRSERNKPFYFCKYQAKTIPGRIRKNVALEVLTENSVLHSTNIRQLRSSSATRSNSKSKK